MTATRLLKLATIVALVGLWFIAAALLWRTRVPSDLHPPRLDAAALYGRAALHRSTRYETFLRLDFVAGAIVGLAVLVLVVRTRRRIVGAFELGRVGSGVMVGAAAAAFAWLGALPFRLAAEWWDHHYGISRSGYGGWVLAQWLGLVVQVVVLAGAVTLVMLLADWFRRWWWVAAAPALVAGGAVFVFVAAFAAAAGTHPIRDGRLRREVHRLAVREGVGGTKVRIQNVSGDTRELNAESTGFGPSTVVVLWNTLMKAHLSRRAVEVVAAHELGHVARRHVLKGLAWSLLFTLPLTLVLAEATRRRGGLHRPDVVPLALLLGTALNLAVLPLENVVSRRYEAEADWQALQATHDPRAAEEAFRSFTSVDLAQPRSPAWAYVLLDDHPTPIQRIAMARAWRRWSVAKNRRAMEPEASLATPTCRPRRLCRRGRLNPGEGDPATTNRRAMEPAAV
jgi:STE24 endopeptidase